MPENNFNIFAKGSLGADEITSGLILK